MRPHRLRVTAFGAFAGDAGGPVQRPRRAVPAARRDRRRQDDAARRDRVRPLRAGAGRCAATPSGCARTTPRPACAPRCELEVTIGGRRLRITRRPEQERLKRSGAGRTKEPASVLLDEADGRRRLGAQVHPDRRGGRRDQPADGHVSGAVLPGGAAAAGAVRAVPARRRAGARGAAAKAVRHRPVPRRRGLAGRAPPVHRRRGRGRRRGGPPADGPYRPGARGRGTGRRQRRGRDRAARPAGGVAAHLGRRAGDGGRRPAGGGIRAGGGARAGARRRAGRAHRG